MNEIQVKVPRETIKRVASNVNKFNCVHRSAVLIKMEDGNWTHNLCCNAGHRSCDCSCECEERQKDDSDKYSPFNNVTDLVYTFMNLSYFRQDYILSTIGVITFLTNQGRASEMGRIMKVLEESNKISDFCRMVKEESESYKAGN